MKLTGVEIQNYRSIGNEPVVLNPLKKCNILIGQNNAGKSNAIRALNLISNSFVFDKQNQNRNRWTASLNRHEIHRKNEANQFAFTLYFETDDLNNNEENRFKKLANMDEFYFQFSNKQGQQAFEIIDYSLSQIVVNDRKDRDRVEELMRVVWGQSYSDQERFRNYILTPQRSKALFDNYFVNAIRPVHIIPVFRQISKGSEYSFNGTNLIGLLAQYQHPKLGNDHEREKFDTIEKFTRRLLHLPNATLEVDHDKEEILIANDGLRLEHSSYGTGVHELIILVTAILSIENAICCIEEPEIHLHPALQREFIKFITTETSNQYVISTHSPTFINSHIDMSPEIAAQIQVFHLQLKDGATVGYPVLEDTHSLSVLTDLGVRASDLLQSNCVIWVEGPSDRIYLNHWLRLVAPNLIEGLHYSIMFYGGRLLSHLSVDRKIPQDDVPEELIDVLRINQHAIVIMDSDRKQPRSRINNTKIRVRNECKNSGGLCWITDGREIEHYLPSAVIEETLPDLVEKRVSVTIGDYDDFGEKIDAILNGSRIKPIKYSSNKVKYARKFIQYFKADHISDSLQKQLNQVVDKIRAWNE